jgi:lysylphosphatidylglycerol synthase-like protein
MGFKRRGHQRPNADGPSIDAAAAVVEDPPLVMGYYVGTLANTLPLPGGIGGVEGGMIGSFLAFGVNGSLAVLAVLGYRTISYWLPTLPGAIAYIRLRRGVAGHRDASGRSSPSDIHHANGSGAGAI